MSPSSAELVFPGDANTTTPRRGHLDVAATRPSRRRRDAAISTSPRQFG
jgi:hypothetical protein